MQNQLPSGPSGEGPLRTPARDPDRGDGRCEDGEPVAFLSIGSPLTRHPPRLREDLRGSSAGALPVDVQGPVKSSADAIWIRASERLDARLPMWKTPVGSPILKNTMISVYGGTGFIGGSFCRLYPNEIIQMGRSKRHPKSKNLLYFLSTTSNYNVYESLHLDIDTNLNVLMEVLEHCKERAMVFNFVSTGFVYGTDIVDAKETDCCDPRGFYSITKRTAEQLLISFCETFGCKYRIFRLSSAYGTDDNLSGKKNVIGFLINKLRNNEDIPLYGGGRVLRDYMHVDDHCRAIHHMMNASQLDQIYNIGYGQPRLFRDILETAKGMLGSTSDFNTVQIPDFYRKVQSKNFTLNIDKLKSYDFHPTITLEEGLNRLCSS